MVKVGVFCGVLLVVVSGCAGEVSDTPEPSIDALDDEPNRVAEAATDVTTTQGKKTLGDPAVITETRIQGKKMFGDGF